jgi:hypothetical protein
MELFYTRENRYKMDLDNANGKRLVGAFLVKVNEDRDVKITKASLAKMIKDGTVFEEIEENEWYNWMAEYLTDREEVSEEGDYMDLEISA